MKKILLQLLVLLALEFLREYFWDQLMKKRTWQNRFEKISEQELEKVLNDVFWEFFWMPKLKNDIINNNNTTLED